MLSDTVAFQEKLVKEMNEMIEKHFDDESVPEVSLSELFNKFINCSPKDQIIINFTIITDTQLVIGTVL